VIAPGSPASSPSGVDLTGHLVVTDLDGTLWDGAARPHPGARGAVARLAAMGAVRTAEHGAGR